MKARIVITGLGVVSPVGQGVSSFETALRSGISGIRQNRWHDTAEAVIDNWVGKVYQLTSHDRKLSFQPGINPNDPLGLQK